MGWVYDEMQAWGSLCNSKHDEKEWQPWKEVHRMWEVSSE